LHAAVSQPRPALLIPRRGRAIRGDLADRSTEGLARSADASNQPACLGADCLRGGAPPPPLAKHDFELFLASRAPHGRRIGWVRRDVEMLARHEARADVLAAERARDLVMVEGPTIDRDSASLVDLLHAASLGACHLNLRKVERRSRARRRRSKSEMLRRTSRCALMMVARSSSRTFAASGWCSRSSRSPSPIPETAKRPR